MSLWLWNLPVVVDVFQNWLGNSLTVTLVVNSLNPKHHSSILCNDLLAYLTLIYRKPLIIGCICFLISHDWEQLSNMDLFQSGVSNNVSTCRLQSANSVLLLLVYTQRISPSKLEVFSQNSVTSVNSKVRKATFPWLACTSSSSKYFQSSQRLHSAFSVYHK